MTIYPAIDIAGGKCVRLYKGLMSQSTVYYENPVDVARMWAESGADWMHVVDLDGAFSGKPENLGIVEDIVKSVDLKIQYGGGIRDADTARRLIELGVSRIVIGTKAIGDREMIAHICDNYAGRFAIALDVKGDKVAVKGWVEESDIDAVSLALDLEKLGASLFIYTQILRDGTLQGPDLDGLKKLCASIDGSVIASGGISSLDDIKKVQQLEDSGVNGVIIGKALYEKAFELKEALELVGA